MRILEFKDEDLVGVAQSREFVTPADRQRCGGCGVPGTEKKLQVRKP